MQCCESPKDVHPLDPMTSEEILQTYRAIHEHICSTPSLMAKFAIAPRFISVSLLEPKKHDMLYYLKNKTSVPREAFTIVLNRSNVHCYEIISSLGPVSNVRSFKYVPDAHPSLASIEYEETEQIVKNCPLVLEALKKRGIHSTENLMVDLWTSGGNYHDEIQEDPRMRIGKPLLFFRSTQSLSDNPSEKNQSVGKLNPLYVYARPIEGLIPVVDMISKKVIRIEDTEGEVIPIPELDLVNPSRSPPVLDADGLNYKVKRRSSLNEYKVVQPQGGSWKIDGKWGVEWMDWKFRIGFTPREGVVLHLVQFWDSTKHSEEEAVKNTSTSTSTSSSTKSTQREISGKWRDVLYRGSTSEMVVPYGDPTWPNYRKNAFDAGEDGLGIALNSLMNTVTWKTNSGEFVKCDCLGDVHYWDACWNDSNGEEPTVVVNAICMHEEDTGVLWKHTDWRDKSNMDMRRGRKLVISTFATVANYDYGFSWELHLDGSIRYEVKMTGFVNTNAYDLRLANSRESMMYREKLNNMGLVSPIHQHFFVIRLDMGVDDFGGKQTMTEVDIEKSSLPTRHPLNLQGNAFHPVETVIHHASGRETNPSKDRFWRCYNMSKKNKVGKSVSYHLMPMRNSLLKLNLDSPLVQRAACLGKQLWITKYHDEQKYPCGTYPNQSRGGGGIDEWVKHHDDNAPGVPVAGEDLVLWYVLGSTHLPRLEDYPIMPVSNAGFILGPDGFFDENPSVDLQYSVCPKVNLAKINDQHSSKL